MTAIRSDGAYALTRRRGKTATVTLLTGTGKGNAQTGAKGTTTTDVTVRWVFKTETSISTIYRGEQTQTEVGDTTFIMWLRDVQKSFTKLTTKDSITYQGETYKVVTCRVEDQAVVVTARAFT